MTNEQAQELADGYRRICRKFDLADAPKSIQQSALALHQHAQLYWMFERRQDLVQNWEEWKASPKKMRRKNARKIHHS